MSLATSSTYQCLILVPDGSPQYLIELTAGSDADAILTAEKVAHAYANCIGVEIRSGDRLVYLHRNDHRESLD